MSGKFKLGDRDFHLSEFRQYLDEQQINESTGGYLNGLLVDLRKTIEGLADPANRSAKGITPQKIKEIVKALDKLELIMKKNLDKSGLIGW